MNQLADAIGRIARQAGREAVRAAAHRDIRDSWADIGAAREALGYEPRIDLDEGLRLTVEYLLG